MTFPLSECCGNYKHAPHDFCQLCPIMGRGGQRVSARQPIAMLTRHQEWMVLPSWRVLHRISSITPDRIEDGLPNGYGEAMCGTTGYFMVPGVLSRLGLRRCSKCCDLIGIPRGDGNTHNALIDEPTGEPWEHSDALRAVWGDSA